MGLRLCPIRRTLIQRYRDLRLHFSSCKSRALADTSNMRVDSDMGFTKGKMRYEIRTFSSNPV
ncbi:hypothetical protein GCM10011309_17240 [Litorimonas cladophorae]|uniref:Uncharacterized protein n=1 Tax=Litorimonas cladophorae TaxID=1220491 RepID=A0A918NF22_9PROT|nr:hypothetical protein GCM10011309_17240 [Litorimonas cladophorae]